MNEGVISSYENYFSGSGLPADLAAEMAMTTSIHASLEADFQHKDLSSHHIQHQNSRRFQHHHHSSTFNNSFVTPGDVTIHTVNNATQMNYVCNNNSAVPNASHNVPANVFTQIPFVQIHTTDVQPQSAFNSTRFRRNATNNHEIKAEPIKSENAETAKDRINATPTPPATTIGTQQRSDSNTSQNSIQNENICTNNKDLDLDGNSSEIVTNVGSSDNMSTCAPEGNTFVFPNIYRCQCCAFISLNESGLQLHLEAIHQGNFNACENALNRVAIHCPGCENIFYTFTSVEVHLREDHLMCEQDIGQLMHAIKNKQQQAPENSAPPSNSVKSSDVGVPNENSVNGTQRRSRIYLKNVECLREPHRDPIEQQDNLITESLFQFENDDCNTLVNIGSISMEDQDFIGMLTSDETTFPNNNKSNNTVDNIVNETITASIELDKPPTSVQPKQKISIKSVDVLCEPALIRRDYEMQTFGDFMNVCNDLNLHVSNNNHNSNNNATNNCEIESNRSTNADVQYHYTNREQQLSSAVDVAASNFEQGYQKPRKPKIYIKNVDILKEPMTFSSTLNGPNITESSSNNGMNFNFMPQTLTQNASNYLDTHLESLNATVPSFSGGVGMSQLPLGTISDQYLFDSGAGNFLSNSTTPSTDNYAYGNETDADGFLPMDANRFTDAITPIITEPTPPPPPQSSAPPTLPLPSALMTNVSNGGNCSINEMPSTSLTNVQKQKIFIKNVDILKEPQFQHEPRGLLHLRTVDELNLMNRREVENLIAPNLESNQTNMIEDELSDNFQQVNTASADPLTANDKNVTEQIPYECENFKLNEFTNTQNSWHDDYDLGEDIRDIITSTMVPSLSTAPVPPQKIIHDLDTPQISLISIPDIEELTCARVQVNIAQESQTNAEEVSATATTQQQDNTNFAFECSNTAADNIMQDSAICSTENARNTALFNAAAPSMNEIEKDRSAASVTANQLKNSSPEVLKQERLNQATPTGEQINSNTNFDNLPPLTAMTSSTTYTTMKNASDVSISVAPNGLPVPPLVPMLQSLPIQLPKNVAITTVANITTVPPPERGRIYVANNLLQSPNGKSSSTSMHISTPIAAPPKSIDTTNTKTSNEQAQAPIAVTVMGGTSVRGRPFGSNRTGITKQRKQMPNNNNSAAGVYLKCTVAGCAFRFKKSTTIDYHIKCHTSESSSQSMVCPECKGSFTNWNSLHTHLWRTHKIDMELYSCQLCNFKTPIYSRLLNTHSKIHYDERNYKCDQCEKAFKNTKQLKNHRRWHRNHNKTSVAKKESTKIEETSSVTSEKLKEKNNKEPTAGVSSQVTTNTTIPTTVPSTAPARSFHRCKDCDAIFSHQKTLREHLCKNVAAAVQCEVCERILTSRSSLKLHMQSHEPSRRFKCNTCDYSTSDHNAFRRHKMTHDNNAKMYACIHCDYKSIQSVAYQKHVQQKHPQFADSIVYKCKICPYATINKALYDVHKIKHENSNTKNEVAPAQTNTENIARDTEISCINKNAQKSTANSAVQKTTKIKVKSHLLLTTPAVDSMMEFNDLCFDAITIPV
ncbi:uncharacterized protein [Eurosta solidaginis]|uniref:uncharacterized protein n=1 Tax=Eurosta solidaginis TaxID=178769 RepID=UPI003530D54D